MKKNFLSVVALLGVVFSLSSCNNNTTSGSTTTTTTNDNQKIRVEYWYRKNDETQTVLEGFERAFEAQNADIDVILTPRDEGNYNELADTVIQGFAVDNYPNMVQAYPDNVANFMFNKSGIVVNMEEYINSSDPELALSQEELEDYIGFETGSNYVEEGTFSLPYYSSTEVMYYNADVMIGMDLTKIDPSINNGRPLDENYMNNLTWEEIFNKLGPAITKHDEGLPEEEKWLRTDKYEAEGATDYYSLMDWESDDNLYITMSEQYGVPYSEIKDGVGTATLFDSSDAKQFVKDLSIQAQKHYLATMGSTGDIYTSELLFSRQCLLNINSTAGAGWLKTSNFEIGVAPIPQAEGQNKKVISQGASICILDRGEEENEATWKWFKFISNKENAVTWALNTSYLPFRKSVYDNAAYKELISDTTAEKGTTDYIVNRAAEVVASYSENDMYFTAPAYASNSGTSSKLREAAAGLAIDALSYKGGEPSDEVINGWFEKAKNNALS